MPGYAGDWDAAKTIEIKVRADLDAGMRAAARLSEFTAGTEGIGLVARGPLSDAEREVAVALNVLARLLETRASEASTSREQRWEGLADAATMVTNELARRGLPEVPEDWSS
jgi:hypothetical protein